MARTRQRAKSAEPSQPPATLPALSPAPSSNVPPQIRFPLLVFLSLTISAVLYTVVSPFTPGDLAIVSNTQDQWWQIAGLNGWKAAQLAVGWFTGYDSSDVAALTFLSHAPYHYLLTSFYNVRPTTAISCLAIDLFATWLPFYALKVSSSIHSVKTPRGVAANRSVINDYRIQAYVTFLAAAIYAMVVLTCYGTWLRIWFINHFDGIRDVSAAYNKNFVWFVASFLPLGFAAKVFSFTPATASKPDRLDKEIAKFDAENATLVETVWYNVWGFSKRTRALIVRTAVLVAVTVLHTSLRVFYALEGAEAIGAVGWSSVWALAATATGAAFWWVADVQGIDN